MPNVLVVTDKKELRDALTKENSNGAFGLRITDCEYRCSMQIEDFRPDYGWQGPRKAGDIFWDTVWL